jgi:5-methylcytosine-specific restriction endonuclease McrA
MTMRHAPHRATSPAHAADKVVATCQTQKTRRANAGPSLQVGHVPHPSCQAQRKGVTVVPKHRPTSPVRPSATPRVGAEPYKKRAIPQAVRREVCIRAGAVFGHVVNIKCAYCPKVGRVSWRYTYGWPQIVDLELDHVIPERHSGPSTADNIVLACRRCNRRKGARLS